MSPILKAPFPWFGGKTYAAPLVWQALGDVTNYIEPFAGSLAVLLNRPHPPKTETVNDIDGYLVNFWRAVKAVPEEVAKWADWPVSELDLTARHAWLVNTGADRLSSLQSNPDFFDAKVAGWWVWGLCSWIGSGWCSGKGPWHLDGGRLRKLPHLSPGRGINRQIPYLSSTGQGLTAQGNRSSVSEELRKLSDRLRYVRITCGDWTRVLGESVRRYGVSGVFLDPPYLTSGDIYSQDISPTLTLDVRQWAIDFGSTPNTRIVLAGYLGEFDMPSDWKAIPWVRGSGGTAYASKKLNVRREILWLSPQCLPIQGTENDIFDLFSSDTTPQEAGLPSSSSDFDSSLENG